MPDKAGRRFTEEVAECSASASSEEDDEDDEGMPAVVCSDSESDDDIERGGGHASFLHVQRMWEHLGESGEQQEEDNEEENDWEDGRAGGAVTARRNARDSPAGLLQGPDEEGEEASDHETPPVVPDEMGGWLREGSSSAGGKEGQEFSDLEEPPHGDDDIGG